MTTRTMASAMASVALLVSSTAVAQFDAPAGYYAGATGTGATLKGQLYDAMRTGHIQRAYGDFRNASIRFDTDPNNASRILLAYNRASNNGTWDSGSTWNREHVWPQSRQPGSASNSTTGNLGDPHALRPCNPSINSSRGNKPFGNVGTTGSFGSQGTFYFPGDQDKGDIARSLFYSDTRWGPERGLSLVSGIPSGNQMGDLDSLIVWHFADPPDTFERRRNHNVATQSENPAFFTNNRNAFIDHPEFVWSVYRDQMNDSQLFFDTPATDGSSMATIELAFFADAPAPSASITLDKLGFDGTYFEIDVQGDFTSPMQGRYNAFPLDADGVDSVSIPLEFASAGLGVYTGVVSVDNLDITVDGGTGVGANDADDIAMVSLSIVDRANASFDDSVDSDLLAIDFGMIQLGGLEQDAEVEIFNLLATAGATAGLDLVLADASGDVDKLFIDFMSVSDVPAGGSVAFEAFFDTDTVGEFGAVYTLMPFDDQTIPGAAPAGEPLLIVLSGTVIGDVCLGDCDGSGTVDFGDLVAILFEFGNAGGPCDADESGTINFADLVSSLFLFGPCP